tara:strand:+ start:157 stop:921 length:765 start_codon:yes stop_codon:yes gene_type:complete
LNNNLEGVYWDLDGTIANTELEAHLPAFNLSFRDYGLSWHWESSNYINLLKINGGKNRISHYSKIINASIPEDIVISIHERKQFHYLEIIKNDVVQLKKGVYRLISELYQKKIRQFIVTSSSKKQVDLLVSHLFPEFNPFEFIISSDDVKFHKPHPLPYLEAIKRSGIKKNKSIVFEDSYPGIKSSLTAGLPTIYTPSNIPTSFHEKINLDCIIECLGDKDDMANVKKGPKLDSKYVNYSFLNKYLRSSLNAKN